jgi:hypothetical protein
MKRSQRVSQESGTVPGEAVVTGLWSLVLHPEPLVKSSLFLSPGAHMKVVELAEAKGAKWTRVILDDGQEGWLEGEPQQGPIGQDGRIAQFSYKDTRHFSSRVTHQVRRSAFCCTGHTS